jgi:hypothetical protein
MGHLILSTNLYKHGISSEEGGPNGKISLGLQLFSYPKRFRSIFFLIEKNKNALQGHFSRFLDLAIRK